MGVGGVTSSKGGKHGLRYNLFDSYLERKKVRF